MTSGKSHKQATPFWCTKPLAHKQPYPHGHKTNTHGETATQYKQEQPKHTVPVFLTLYICVRPEKTMIVPIMELVATSTHSSTEKLGCSPQETQMVQKWHLVG